MAVGPKLRTKRDRFAVDSRGVMNGESFGVEYDGSGGGEDRLR